MCHGKAKRRGRVSSEGVEESIGSKEERGKREGGRKGRRMKVRKRIDVGGSGGMEGVRGGRISWKRRK